MPLSGYSCCPCSLAVKFGLRKGKEYLSGSPELKQISPCLHNIAAWLLQVLQSLCLLIFCSKWPCGRDGIGTLAMCFGRKSPHLRTWISRPTESTFGGEARNPNSLTYHWKWWWWEWLHLLSNFVSIPVFLLYSAISLNLRYILCSESFSTLSEWHLQVDASAACCSQFHDPFRAATARWCGLQ